MHTEESERRRFSEIGNNDRGEKRNEKKSQESEKKEDARRRNFHFISRISPYLPYTSGARKHTNDEYFSYYKFSIFK
jgi:hypothetical protein